MDLQAVRIEAAWSCPVHSVVMEDGPGECPFDGRELVQVTIDHFWVCSGSETALYSDAGRCIDGRPRQERKRVREHGDHNPRHGGQFFMAADKWHHLEGKYSTANVFRLYFYDSFTEPLDPVQISGRVFTREEAGREVDPVELTRSKDGKTLEARIGDGTLPLTITARIRFKPGTADQRFDFTLTASKDFGAGSPVRPSRGMPRPTAAGRNAVPPKATVAAADAPNAGSPPGVSGSILVTSPTPNAQTSPPPPGAIAEVLALLEIRTREVRTLIDQGSFAVVYLPTMLAKDLALALGARAREFPAEQREAAVLAVKRIVLSAWDLDRCGDLGDRANLVEAYDTFARAVSDLRMAYDAR